MSYSISISGHGADPDDVRGAFEEAVRTLRGATPEGGTFTAFCSDGTGSYSADDVPDEAADTSDEAAPTPEGGADDGEEG